MPEFTTGRLASSTPLAPRHVANRAAPFVPPMIVNGLGARGIQFRPLAKAIGTITARARDRPTHTPCNTDP